VRVIAGRANRLGAGSSDKKPTTPARAGSHVGRSALPVFGIPLPLKEAARSGQYGQGLRGRGGGFTGLAGYRKCYELTTEDTEDTEGLCRNKRSGKCHLIFSVRYLGESSSHSGWFRKGSSMRCRAGSPLGFNEMRLALPSPIGIAILIEYDNSRAVWYNKILSSF